MKTDLLIPDLFTAEDADVFGYGPPRAITIERANARFREWAEGLTKVYGHKMYDSDQWMWGTEINPPDALVPDTHTALVCFPQEIKKKKKKKKTCEHEVQSYFDNRFGVYYGTPKCAKCGARLKAKWTEINDK